MDDRRTRVVMASVCCGSLFLGWLGFCALMQRPLPPPIGHLCISCLIVLLWAYLSDSGRRST